MTEKYFIPTESGLKLKDFEAMYAPCASKVIAFFGLIFDEAILLLVICNVLEVKFTCFRTNNAKETILLTLKTAVVRANSRCLKHKGAKYVKKNKGLEWERDSPLRQVRF